MKAILDITNSLKSELGEEKVLSIYLNVDQSYAPNRLRGFEVVLKDKLREIETGLTEPNDRREFRQCVDAALHGVQFMKPGSGTIIAFTHADGSIRTWQLDVPLETEVHWLDHPCLQPLLSVEGALTPILLVITDHQHSRILTSDLGHFVEHPSIENTHPSKHTKTAGKDHIKSQTNFNRKSDERVAHYLTEVAKSVEEAVKARSIERIFLAGNHETSRQLHKLLSKDIQKRTSGFLGLTVGATPLEIREAFVQMGSGLENEAAVSKVDSLLGLRGSHAMSVLGLSATLDALRDGRIRDLVYSERPPLIGSRCTACNAVYLDQIVCPACGSSLTAIDDVIDYAIETARKSGATVEKVRGAAAEKLSVAGGLGGFLRY